MLHDKLRVFVSRTLPPLACVAWLFLSNLRALGKRESGDEERQSREEPGRETASPLYVLAFNKLPSYAGYPFVSHK